MSERPQSVIALQGLDLKLKMLAPTNLLPQGLKKQDLTQIQVICSKTETLWFPIRAKNEIRLVVVGRGGGGFAGFYVAAPSAHLSLSAFLTPVTL